MLRPAAPLAAPRPAAAPKCSRTAPAAPIRRPRGRLIARASLYGGHAHHGGSAGGSGGASGSGSTGSVGGGAARARIRAPAYLTFTTDNGAATAVPVGAPGGGGASGVGALSSGASGFAAAQNGGGGLATNGGGGHVPPTLAAVLGGGGGGGGGASASAASNGSASNGSTAPAGNSANGAGGTAAPAAAAPAANGAPLSTTSSGSSSVDLGDSTYWDLLMHPDADASMARAKSASDASLLRRKGHLKEQDRLIEYIRRMHETHTCEEVMLKMERWIAEHRQDPRRSRLKRIVPTVGSFFTPLRLVDAFREYDAFFHLSRRRYIPPNFAELRHILNIAQVHASADTLKLITFDADGTLYADGAHMEQDSEMIRLMVSLMRLGVHVAIVTAAGYPGEPAKFEARIEGLLSAFRRLRLSPETVARFHLMGGECNYLLRVNPGTWRLEFVPDEEWQTPEMRAWKEDDIRATLDEAQKLLVDGAARLMMPVHVIRKTRSVGVIPSGPTIYEVLEDLAITVQNNLISRLPFCAFNGGNDVFVDIGNKSIGLDALERHVGASPPEVMHVGDRFTDSGNDTATRDVCSIVWVANPEETGFFIRMLLSDLRTRRMQRYIE